MRPPDRLQPIAGVLSYFTRHATAANLLLVLLVAAGLAALPRMRAQYFPDVVLQQIDVTVKWDGAGANDVDQAIIQLLEPGLIAVEGVDSISSTAREGYGRITLEFEPGWDMSRAQSEVEAAVAAVTNLPDSAEDPRVVRRAWRDRVTDIVLTGPVDAERLLGLADEFLLRLYRVGVTRAAVQGLTGPEITIEVPQRELLRHGLSLAEVARIVGAEADAAPAGDISGAGARLRTGAERRTPEELAAIVLKSLPDNSVLTLGDVARITETRPGEGHAYFVGDNPALLVRVERSADGDAIGIQHLVEQVAAEMRPTLPDGVAIDLIRTRSENITARLEILIDNGLLGLGLVLTLLFLFLNARTAFWVAAGIPVAMLATAAMMFLAGITINMISLFALILTLGIVIDDAIVVGEHADFRFRRLGEPPAAAAENAVRRMAAPVLSSTLTTIVAFLGLMAITGRFGDLISEIPFTVSVVLLASLIECFLILPNHMAHALSKAGRGKWYDAPSRVMNRGLAWVRERLLRPLVGFVIVARYPLIAAMVLLLSWEGGLFLRGEVGWRFFNAPEQATISANFAMVEGASRADTRAMLGALQETVDEVARRFESDYGSPATTYVLGEIGANAWPPLASAETRDKDLLGSISIELSDPDLRPWRSHEFLAALQEAAPRHPLLEELAFRSWRHGPGGDALDVQFMGADAATLKAAAEELKRSLAAFPEVSGLDDSLPYDKNEMVLRLTPQGRALGFTIEELGATLRDRLSGIEAATFPAGTRTATVRVELPTDEIAADFLERTFLPTDSGDFVALADIVSVELQSGFSTIRREGGQRVVSVTGDIDDSDAARVAAIETALNGDILPRIAAQYGAVYELAGLSQQEDQFLNDALVGFMGALLGIYAVLAWIFSSWARPLVVMAVIPLGLIGAIHGHWVWGLPLSMFSVVGLIGMSGIIINDAIVLVTTIDDYARDRPLRRAVVDAVADRFRPVFLTTATTVLGLAPLLYEGSRQAEFLKPTVVTLCFGLGFGMVLVILVVPAVVIVQSELGRAFTALRRAWHTAALRPTIAALALLMAAAFAGLMVWVLRGEMTVWPAMLRFVAIAAALVAATLAIVGLRRRRAS